MKKLFYCLTLLVIARPAHTQGFMKKLKDKASNALNSNKTNTPAAAGSNATTTDPAYAEPAPYGTAIYQLKDESQIAGDGMLSLSLESAEVVGNDLHAKINIDGQLYDYANGQMKATGEKFVMRSGKAFMGSEKDRASVDISDKIQFEYLSKKTPRIASGPIRGQLNQTYTFNGKLVGSGVCTVVRNYDSTAIALMGADYAKPGHVGYFLMTSKSQRQALPGICMGIYLSPDGKMAATMKQTGAGGDVYLSDGRKITLTQMPGGDRMWLKNSGSIFMMDPESKKLFRNNDPFLDLNNPRINISDIDLFISEDEKKAAYCNYMGVLYFTDRVTLENTYGVRRLIINNKETLVFLAGSRKDKKIYLCRIAL